MNTPTPDSFAEIVDEQQVPAKYLSIFIDETELALDSLAETLVCLEAEAGGSSDDVESLLILSHRIKGSAASVGLNRPAKLAHLMEDVLQDLRESGSGLATDLTDPFLDCIDALRLYVSGLRTGEPESSGFNACANDLIQRYSAVTAASNGGPDAEQTSQAESEATPSESPQVREIDAALLAEAKLHVSEGNPTIAGRVWFEEGLPLAGLKARLVFDKLQRLGKIPHFFPLSDTIEELDDLSCLEFVLLGESDEQAIRQTLSISGVHEIQLQTLPDDAASPPIEERSVALAAVENSAAKPAIAQPGPIEGVVGTSTPAAATSTTVKKADEKPKAASPPRDASNNPVETVRVDIDRLDHLMNLAGQLVINKARFSQISESLKESLPAKQAPQLVANAESLAEKMVNVIEQQPGASVASLDLDVMRSHARRMRADLAAVSKEVNRLTALRTGINGLLDAVHQLDRVTDGIQKSVMETRMVPVGPLFGRFKRVVRDITRANDKKIRLEIRGEKTELDKRMIDELGDPLIHMVRNSADHGIESPGARLARGKPEEGVVTLDAYHQGNSIIIQVTDDGQGLDETKILNRAIEKGLVTEADAQRLTRFQIQQFIWDPGFTTAEQVTEISGRGMGMDIVRSKIEQLNGLVEVDSEVGRGSTFTIKLPLTMAILPSLMATIKGDVFALPIESIQEIVSLPTKILHRVHGQTTATIRDRIVSVVQLTDIFTWPQAAHSAEDSSNAECTLVVLTHEGKEIGLVVDHLLGEQDIVIKSMAENFQNIPGIAGASILGNGSVSLILDTAALIEMSAGIVPLKDTADAVAT